jgi:hypothetical protein
MQNMSNQQWLMQCRWIMWNDTSEISLRTKNKANDDEKNIDNQLSTLSNSKMPNQKLSSIKTNMFYSAQKKNRISKKEIMNKNIYIIHISPNKLRGDWKDGNEIIFDSLNINTLTIKNAFLQGHLNHRRITLAQKIF